jgi:hypothetical protein
VSEAEEEAYHETLSPVALAFVLRERRPLIAAAGRCVRVPFAAWVGRHLARGVLALDRKGTAKVGDSGAKESPGSLTPQELLAAARRLTAVFSKGNYTPPEEDTGPPCSGRTGAMPVERGAGARGSRQPARRRIPLAARAGC